MLNLTQKYKNNFDTLMINFDPRTNTELINTPQNSKLKNF